MFLQLSLENDCKSDKQADINNQISKNFKVPITMNIYKKNLLYSSLVILLLGLFTIHGCDTTSSDDHEEHYEAWGIALFQGGTEIARQFAGEITYADGDHLELHVGEESPLINIRFLDEDGDTFVPDDDDYFLGWEIGHENILSIEQHSEDGKWGFHFIGLSAGETHLVFELWHDDHIDFVSGEFDVHVEQEVEGARIEDESGITIVSLDSNNEVTGQFSVEAGSFTEQFTIFFLDGEGNDLELDHDYELEWHIENPGIAAIEKVDGEEWVFVIQGIEVGTTDVHFELVMHLDDHEQHDSIHTLNDEDDHDDEIVVYETPHIDIIVLNNN